MKKKMMSTACLLALLLAACGCRQGTNPPALSPAPQASATGALPGPSASGAGPESYRLVTPDNPETPAPTLGNEALSISESQTFLNYTSTAGGYDVQAPENWDLDAKGADVRFTHGHSGVSVEVVKTAEPFNLDTIKGVQVASLVKTGRAVDVKSVELVNTKSGPAASIVYESNSEPEGGKQIRLMNHRYYYPRGGRLAVLTMWAPLGADNENIWRQIPDTFFWR